MHRPVRGLLALAATTATVVTAALVAAPAAANAAPAPAAKPGPGPGPVYDTHAYSWGPTSASTGTATAEGRAVVTVASGAANPESRVEVEGVLRHMPPLRPHHRCAYVEFEYRTAQDPLGAWHPADSFEYCKKGAVGFAFAQQNASALRVRVGRTALYASGPVELGQWHEIYAAG